MAKLRKMLGDVMSQDCLAIMALIGTQSKHTVEKWAVEYAAEKVIPIYTEACPGEDVLPGLVEKCREYIAGDMKLSGIKPLISEGRKLASTTKGDVAQAAARAVSTACAAITTPTNAFGFLMYAAAAVAYTELGLGRTQEEYDAVATREMACALESLKAVAVPDEPNPVKVVWNC